VTDVSQSTNKSRFGHSFNSPPVLCLEFVKPFCQMMNILRQDTLKGDNSPVRHLLRNPTSAELASGSSVAVMDEDVKDRPHAANKTRRLLMQVLTLRLSELLHFFPQ